MVNVLRSLNDLKQSFSNCKMVTVSLTALQPTLCIHLKNWGLAVPSAIQLRFSGPAGFWITQ